MSEKVEITQEEIDHAVRERLSVVVPLLRLLSTEEDNKTGGFTADGMSTLLAARTVSWDAAMYLAEEISDTTTEEHRISLLFDVQRFMAVVACALKSMQPDGPPWVESPHTVRYLLELARDLQKRAEAEAEGVAHDVVCNVCGRSVSSLRAGDDCPTEGCAGRVYVEVSEAEEAALSTPGEEPTVTLDAEACRKLRDMSYLLLHDPKQSYVEMTGREIKQILFDAGRAMEVQHG